MSEQSTEALRDDGPYENVFLNVGNKGDRSAYTRAVTPRLLQYTELEGLYEGDGFARRIIDLPAEEMVRAGYDIEGVEDDGDVRAELENIQALEKLCDAMRWSALYGGAIVIMLINDGGTLEEPLVVEKAKSLEQLRVYDRWQVTHHQKYLDPNDMRFGKTELYMVSPIEGTPYIVHESRCLVFDGVPVPDRVRERNDSWGASKVASTAQGRAILRTGMRKSARCRTPSFCPRWTGWCKSWVRPTGSRSTRLRRSPQISAHRGNGRLSQNKPPM